MFAFQHPAGAPVLPAACAQESNSVPKLSFMVPAWLGQAQNGVASDGIVPNRDISWLKVWGQTQHRNTPITNTWHFLSLVPLHKSQLPTTVIVVACSTSFVDGEIAIYLVVLVLSTAAQIAETQFPGKTPIKL